MPDLTQDQRERIAAEYGLKPSTTRWIRGDTAEEFEADLREYLVDAGREPKRLSPPTKQPRERLAPGVDDPDDEPTTEDVLAQIDPQLAPPTLQRASTRRATRPVGSADALADEILR